MPSGPAEQAAPGPRVEVLPLTGGFVAGQESALVNQVNGRPGVPSDPLVPVYRRGVDGRPTLVLNAETLAQLALLARYGADWFRAVGTAVGPGHVPGHHQRLVRDDRCPPRRARGAARCAAALAARRPRAPTSTASQAVLVGGYHGAWVPGSQLDAPMTVDDLARFGAAPGAGVVHVLDRDRRARSWRAPGSRVPRRPERPAVRPVRQRAAPDGRARCTRSPYPGRGPAWSREVDRLRALVDGRGACAHPDGTARFVASTMQSSPTTSRNTWEVSAVRVHVDWTRCDGHGACAELLPELLDTRRVGLPPRARRRT